MRILLTGLLGVLLLWLLLVQKVDSEEEELIQEQSDRLPGWLFRMGVWLYRQRERLMTRCSEKGWSLSGSQTRQYRKYQAGHIDSWSETEYRRKQVRQLALAWLVLPVSCLLAMVLSWKTVPVLSEGPQGWQLLRPKQWNRSEEYEFYVEGLGEAERISVTIDGQLLSGAEKLLQEKAEHLEELILGENDSLERVYRNLNLIGELDGEIDISWKSGQPELITNRGIVANRELEQPQIIQLCATLTYGETELVKMIPVQIMPAIRDADYYRELLLAELQKRNEEQREEPHLTLPERLEEKKLGYRAEEDHSPLYLLLLGVIVAVCFSLQYGQQIEADYQKRNRMLQREYSSLVSQLAILLQCGLSVRSCWQRMVQAYDRGQTAQSGSFSYAYEEMRLTYRQIAGGMQESRAYLDFGNRCDLYLYRRLGMLLEQTVRQGSSGLAQILENEAFQAMEERKNLARKRAAEAETKMMLPMFLMLGIVIVIVMVPALMTM